MIKEFSDRAQFRNWLSAHAESPEGIWIRIFKDKSKASITAEEALDECLCYGWIDGVMKSEGDVSYLKYYAPRSKNSKWSEKNKKSVERLRRSQLMTEYGERAVARAIENGQWQQSSAKPDFEHLIAQFMALLQQSSDVADKFALCPESRKKQYVGFYFDAKT
jgi:uncharacterized protein YdeI (YjbR/CyaY-like superfamily)